VPDLTSVAASTDEWPAIDEDATADTDVTGEVQHGAALACPTAQVLREDTEVGIIADPHVLSSATHALAQRVTEGNIRPAKVRCKPHQSIAGSDHAGNAGARAHEDRSGGHLLQDRATHLGDLVDENTGPVDETRALDLVTVLGPSEDLAAETHEGRDRAIDSYVESEDHGRPRHGLDDEGRATNSPDVSGTLPNQAESREFADKVPDGAAVESGEHGQLRPRLGAAEMQQSQHCGQVRAADLVLGRSGKGGHAET
jgi:hypothetical protein